MAWPHPFIVIDQNKLRFPELVSQVVTECQERGCQVLLPDGAFHEFAKAGELLETAKNSLKSLAPHRELVCSAHKLARLMSDERVMGEPTANLVHDETTDWLRRALRDLDAGDDSTLMAVLEGPNAGLMTASQVVWGDDAANRELVLSIRNVVQTLMSPAQAKELRKADDKGQAIGKWLASIDVTRQIFAYLKACGLDDRAAYHLTRNVSVSSTFLAAMFGLGAHWLASGGLEAASPKTVRGDLDDAEYIVLGAVSRSLASNDHRAAEICNAVKSAFTARQLLPE
jgi:hypothetical protein